MRTLAIGDIHGCLRAFDLLMEQVDLQPEDLLITLGDYVDRGPDSKAVLDRLIALHSRNRCVALRGNHDIMMLNSRENLLEFDEWVRCGGRQTLDSYEAGSDWAAFAGFIPESHWKFLAEQCVPYYETDKHIFVHANLSADVPLADQPDYMLFWERIETAQWRPHESGKTMICGHSAQRSGRPLVLEAAVCLDTWVYGDGWLTCLELQTEVYWQANQRGETRMGNLGFRDR